VACETGDSGHSLLCLQLMQLFPRVARGMRRHQGRAAPGMPTPLGPRHIAALQHLRGGPLTVGALAAELCLTLPTVSGVLGDLDRADLIDRHADHADRRRTIVAIKAARRPVIEEWLDGAAAPLARVLDRLGPSERTAFLKAMDMLEAELRDPGTEAGQR
jgi:DNA-binding MarR family transcriptional regulator